MRTGVMCPWDILPVTDTDTEYWTHGLLRLTDAYVYYYVVLLNISQDSSFPNQDVSFTLRSLNVTRRPPQYYLRMTSPNK